MSIGTGLFLGLACISLVYLYTHSRESSRWRLIVRWFGALVASLAIVGLVVLGYFGIQERLASRPKRVSSYANISVGDSKDEVRYALGSPTEVAEDAPSTSDLAGWQVLFAVSDLKDGKHFSDYDSWTYDSSSEGRIDVDFSPESGKVIRVFCYATAERRCPQLLGISDGATEDEVVQRLGEPSAAEIGPKSPEKKISYNHFNVVFLLVKRRVYALQLESDEWRAQRERESLEIPKDRVSEGSPRPPACASARNQLECAEMLKKAGENPYGAIVPDFKRGE